MNLFHLSLRGTLLALLVLAVSCASPLANLITGKAPSALPPLGPGETRLVFSTGGNLNESRAIATNGYMTIQLRSQADGTTKFATSTTGAATGGGATYTFTISGLVAGLWNMKVMLYDNQTSQTLLHYGNTQTNIVPGTDNNVPIALYVPGTINGITATEALLVTHVTILEQLGSETSKTLPMGIVWDLDAFGYTGADDAILATQPAVTWSSSDEDIAWVSSSGRVTVVNPGNATITAASVENPSLKDTYTIIGVPAVWGNWKWSDPMGEFRVLQFTATEFHVIEGNARGSFAMSRGTYTHLDGILRMEFTGGVNPTTMGWATTASGPMVLYTWVTPTSMQVQQTENPMSVNGGMEGPSNGPKLFSRIDTFVESIGVTIPTAVGGAFTMVQGDNIQEYISAIAPTNATVPVMAWLSSDSSKAGYDPNKNSGFRALAATSPVTITAYSPRIPDPIAVATYSVTVVADSAPPFEVASDFFGSYSQGTAYKFFVEVSDANTGINPASISVTVTGATFSTVNVLPLMYSGENVIIQGSLMTSTYAGSGSMDIMVSDNANNQVTISKPFTVN